MAATLQDPKRTGFQPTAAAVIVAALIVSVPFTHGGTWAVAAGVLAGLTAWVAARRDRPALRVLLLVDVVMVFGAIGTFALPVGYLAWPTTILLALAAGAVAVRFWPALRPVAPWLRRGRMTRDLPWMAAGIVVASAAALTLWTVLADPQPPPFVANLSHLPLLVVLAGIVGFSAVNSIAEEFLYRGVLQTELTTLAGAVPAVLVQAVAFGVAHVHGFPSGWIGVLMSGGWGLILGIVRLRTGGILAVYLIHILADTTIGLLGLVLLR